MCLSGYVLRAKTTSYMPFSGVLDYLIHPSLRHVCTTGGHTISCTSYLSCYSPLLKLLKIGVRDEKCGPGSNDNLKSICTNACPAPSQPLAARPEPGERRPRVTSQRVGDLGSVVLISSRSRDKLPTTILKTQQCVNINTVTVTGA